MKLLKILAQSLIFLFPQTEKSQWDPSHNGKFTRRYVRDHLYKARSKLKNLTIEDIGLGSHGENKIFIQESLTPGRRELFQKCNELNKKCKFRYIWSFYGNIFLRKNDTSAPITSERTSKIGSKAKAPFI